MKVFDSQLDFPMMAPLKAFFTLSIGLLLAHQTLARNDAPCQPTTWNNGYKTFVRHHIPSGTPDSLNQTEWKNFIQAKTGCGRPTQSFLSSKDLDKVREVCSSKGGMTHKENLCISRESFTFVTVRSVPHTCGIKSVREEKKHLILACEVLGDDCLPVHFEGNPENLKPSVNAGACQDPRIKGRAPSLSMTWLCVPVSILLLLWMDVNSFV